MSKRKSMWLNWTTTLMATLMLIGSVIIGAWGYVEINDWNPNTVSTAYVQTVTDQYGVEKPFIEINNMSAENGTGRAMFELAFNAYTGIDMQAVKTYGVQILYDINDEPVYYYYEKVDTISYHAVNELEWGDPLVVDIDDEVFQVALTGTYTVTRTSLNPISLLPRFYVGLVQGLLGGDFSALNWQNIAYDTVTTTYPYTYEEFYEDVKIALTTTSEGFGDYALPLVDLANYFSVAKLNEDTLQFDSIAGPDSFSMNYFGVQVHNDRYGVVAANQSMFGMVADDSEYNAGIVGGETNYWTERFVYNLSTSDFNLRQSSYFGGLVASVKPEIVKHIIGNDALVIQANIDADALNIVGFDYFAFGGLYMTRVAVYADGEFNTNGAEAYIDSLTVYDGGVIS